MPGRKLDLYREHREEYATPKTPTLVKVGRAKYLTIVGQGEPGGKVFTEKLGALYAVAFTLKMRNKFAGRDYRVCAMEGLWWGSHKSDFLLQPRETWQWKILIRTPDFITQKDLASAVAELLKKGKPSIVREVQLETITEGQCVQMLHIGPYAAETATIEAMHEFAAERGLVFHGLHHEIYLSDPRRVPPARLRTILRLPVKRAARQ